MAGPLHLTMTHRVQRVENAHGRQNLQNTKGVLGKRGYFSRSITDLAITLLADVRSRRINPEWKMIDKSKSRNPLKLTTVARAALITACAQFVGDTEPATRETKQSIHPVAS